MDSCDRGPRQTACDLVGWDRDCMKRSRMSRGSQEVRNEVEDAEYSPGRSPGGPGKDKHLRKKLPPIPLSAHAQRYGRELICSYDCATRKTQDCVLGYAKRPTGCELALVQHLCCQELLQSLLTTISCSAIHPNQPCIKGKQPYFTSIAFRIEIFPPDSSLMK